MTRSGWDSLAEWRDHRMGERGDLWHRALIDPALLSVLGSVRGRRVLDIGCGNGYLTRRFRRQGASRAVGVDASAASIRLARRREAARPTGAEFVHADAAHLRRFDDGTFDRAVANMSLMDIRDARGTVHEAGRLLSAGGRFVFSIGHACFEIDARSSWSIERVPYVETISRRVQGYRCERPVRVPWRVSERETAYTTSYHRTLATYSRYLEDAGLGIVRMVEPAPKPEMIRKSDQGRFIAEIPLHLVIHAAPWSRGAKTLPRPGSPMRGAAPAH